MILLSMPILPLTDRGFNTLGYGFRGCAAFHSQAKRWTSEAAREAETNRYWSSSHVLLSYSERAQH